VSLWSMAALRVRPARPWIDAFLAVTQRRCALGAATPRQLTACFWALGVLRVEPDSSWMRTFWAASEQGLRQAEARSQVAPPGRGNSSAMAAPGMLLVSQAAADVLCAAVHLGLQPPPRWVRAHRRVLARAASAAAEASIPAADAPTASVVLGWSPRMLQGAPSYGSSCRGGECTSRFAGTSEGVSAVVQDASAARALSKLLWALAKLHLHPGPLILADILHALRPALLAALDGEALAQTVWAAAHLSATPCPLWADALARRCCEQAPRLSGPQLLRTAWGLSRLKPGPSPELLGLFSDLAVLRAQQVLQPLPLLQPATRPLPAELLAGGLRPSPYVAPVPKSPKRVPPAMLPLLEELCDVAGGHGHVCAGIRTAASAGVQAQMVPLMSQQAA
jgi:hypothetical protein